MEESIGAVQLGEPTDKKFLSGLIPGWFEEKVYENDNFWACECKRTGCINSKYHKDYEIEFDKICKEIKKEFSEYLMEIYSITSVGIHFIVYLKKKSK